MGISVWLVNWMLPLALLSLLSLIAAVSFAWGVKGQRTLSVEAAHSSGSENAAPNGRLERAYRIMMWVMAVCCIASLAAAGIGLSALL